MATSVPALPIGYNTTHAISIHAGDAAGLSDGVGGVCAAMKIQVQEQSTVIEADGIHKAPAIVEVSRSPNAREIACCLVIWGPIAVAAMLARLWIVRRLKSYRRAD
jgi:hypothetical protein